MAEQYGFYVSVRLPSGELCSSFRETVAEVKSDLAMFLGEIPAKNVVANMAKAGQQTSETEAVANIKAVFPEATVEAPVEAPAPQQESPAFESCSDMTATGPCGTLKDRWVPPGTSKAGKPYKGFYSCPNWKNHSK